MLFHEVYGLYYHTVARLLAEAIAGKLTKERLYQLAQEHAFGESALTIVPALEKQEWPLITADYTTPLRHVPTMPLTMLQKQWLKALTLDPRFRLFDIQLEELEDVQPLFTPADYVVFDRYNDGDPYEDETYIQHFRMLLQALHTEHPLRIEYQSPKGGRRTIVCSPLRLEYSEKDDKFRLYARDSRCKWIINVGRIVSCQVVESWNVCIRQDPKPRRQWFTLEVTDERNALERVLLHFAHFEKQAEKQPNGRYRVTVWYERDDETELVIRVLSFGPMVRVTEPQGFVRLIKDRLCRQQRYELR